MISKILSIGILFGSITLKVPQIKTMLSAQTAQGASFMGEFSDAFIFALSGGS